MKLRAISTAALILLLVSVSATRLHAQESNVAVDLDHASFASSDTTSLLELYFAFGAETLPFEPDTARYQAMIPVQVRLTPEGTSSEPVWSDSLRLRFTVSDTAALQSGQMFLHQLRASVPPGSYALTVEQLEADTSAFSMSPIQRTVAVPDFATNSQPQFSDVSLASRIHRSKNQSSLFYKNGLLIRPNPRLIYGPGLSRLYYYVELYRPGGAPGVEDRYRFRSYVTPVDRSEPIDSLERTVERTVRSPDVLVGRFNVSSLPSGSYEFHAELRAGGDSVVAGPERKFYIYNPDQPREAAPVDARPDVSARYRTMDEETINAAIGAVNEIATDAEREIIDQLESLQDKRSFLTRFWARRDETPGTASNEHENQFYKNLRLVRDQYGTPFSEPWETDRGRVMLQYGRPDQIDPHLHERETRPYVIWQYDHVDGDGQATFVFIDTEGFGEFDLVHSTATGEVKNPEWRRLIQ